MTAKQLIVPGVGFFDDTAAAGNYVVPGIGFFESTGAGGAAAALAGAAADVATATGDLSTPGGAAALAGAATDTATAAAGLSTAIPLGGSAADVATASGDLASPPTFVSESLVRNTGEVVANVTLTYVRLYNPTTGALVVSKSGITTDAGGVFRIADAAVTSGLQLSVDWLEPTGERCMPVKTVA